MRKQESTLKRVLKLIRPYRFYLYLALLFAVISVVLTLYVPILIGKGVDLCIGKGQVDFPGIFKILINLAVVVGFTAFTQWLMNLTTNHITYHVVKDLRTMAFRHMEKVPVSFLDAHQPGDIMNRIVTDVDQFSDGLLLGFTQLFTGVITILGTLGFMLSIHVKITLIVALITPVSLFVASFIANRTFSMFQLQSKTRGEMTSLVEELVGNQKIVKAFSYEKEGEKRFEEVNEKLRVFGIRALFFSSVTNPATRFINGLVYAGVGIFGAFTAIQGGITVGQLTSFLNYANQYTKPFNEISQVMAEFQNALACAKQIFEFVDIPLETPDKENAVVLQEADGSLAFEHVSFSYAPETPLLKDIHLTVEPGQRIALVGPTGCGKTTLINLLMRFYDIQSGKIEVSGYPIEELTRNSLRGQFGMVLQETWLRSGTILKNIAYGKEDATREEIVQAAKAAYAHSFIKRMPDGYDTVVSEDGGMLSQGEKQLLCIARVMLLKPPMLILDEATSSIDTRTEIKVQKAFEKLMKGRTSFVVAHRLSTIREADVILVMKDGRIVEKGKHEELLGRNGLYKNIFESQFVSV